MKMANKPTVYELHGGGIHVSYSTTSISGQPLFTYHDSFQVKNFSGDQIKAVQTDVGSLVTVVIHMTVDSGSTTFSLLIPNVILPPSNVTNISAEGITTLQKFSIPPPVGQTQFYTVHKLHGTASFVVA
jgi:hypothetical protein